MKTRAEIYGNEATDLLRIVTMYPGLCEHQLLCFHPGKEDTAKALLSHLERQGRIFQTDGGGYFLAGQTPKTDHALVRAVWVLLDFIRQVDYHAPADFPVKLVFFADGELYEIAYDNLSEKQLLDLLSSFVMADDTGLLCDAYNTAELGDQDCTKIYIMEKQRFPQWLTEHKTSLQSISDF